MIRALEFVGPLIHTASRPLVFRCDDGYLYVCKMPRHPHPAPDLVLEQLFYGLGEKLGAPVPPGATIVTLDDAAIGSAEKAGADVRDIVEGPASGTRYMPNTGDLWLWVNAPDWWRRERDGARLDLLLSWFNLSGWALQLLQTPPRGFVAMDVGDVAHDGRPLWRLALPAPLVPSAAVAMSGGALVGDIDDLEGAMSDRSISDALDALPLEWVSDRGLIASYLAERREIMLARLRALREQAS